MGKQCFKCGETKPLTEFYAHSRMADGHLNKCKVCTKKDVADHREENKELIQAYDRERSKTEKRRLLNLMSSRQRASTEEGRKKIREGSKRSYERHKLKAATRVITARAIQTGKLKRQPCERCGASRTEAHHEDYLKPLEVTWLCRKCHGQRHREINEERRKNGQ